MKSTPQDGAGEREILTGKKAESEENGRIRHAGSERRQEIAAAALKVIAKYGLTGATNRRIAEAVGLSPPALYVHFDNRQEILLVAMDLVVERIFGWLAMSSNLNVIEHLREIGHLHASHMAAEYEGFVIPSFEFMMSPQNLDLRRRFGQKQLQINAAVADIIEAGKAQGSVRQDVEAHIAAWEFMMFAIGEDIAGITGREEFITDGISLKILERFLASISSEPQALGAG